MADGVAGYMPSLDAWLSQLNSGGRYGLPGLIVAINWATTVYRRFGCGVLFAGWVAAVGMVTVAGSAVCGSGELHV